jgi:hypothetical protein
VLNCARAETPVGIHETQIQRMQQPNLAGVRVQVERPGADATSEWRAAVGLDRRSAFAPDQAIQPLMHRAARRGFTVKMPYFTVFLP